ncbi:hypothetical protein SAZ10_00550 [Mesorhizobium sp. BAC0120]|uniref:hypothetical protein n=1 Tax=Mesorhizobium sp. BAC0120 TaxID=3090670 RepID=UPI00298BD41E|nr:hypothetical protein [Mesorhizobium sp. BAC0120]MDW6020245.1 hypothetical protein [Mesorhizobium sp. BAC0120]
MADELNPVAENEPENPEIEQQPESGPLEGERPEGGEPREDGPQEEIELDTIELDGKAYQIPKALKPGFMMQADYTRKTQEVARARRELEHFRENLTQHAQAADEEMTQRAALVALDAQLQQFAKLNWDQLSAEDPLAANREFMRFQALEKVKDQIGRDLAQKSVLRSQAAQHEIVSRFEQTQDYASKNIKGWSPELDREIIDWAMSKGATEQNILSAMSPMVYEMLYLARIGDQALKKQPAAPNNSARARPTSTVGGKSNPSAGKSLSEMSMDEYVEYRRRQMGSK